MFALPQPSDPELVEGCPVVRLPDLEAEVTSFLKALFEPEWVHILCTCVRHSHFDVSRFFMPFPAPTDFDTIVGCLRLAHKYGVDYLRRRALVHLSSGYHTRLSQYDATYYDPDPDSSRSFHEICSWDLPDDNGTYNIATIQLAREVDAPWILPFAFYSLARSYILLGSGTFHGVDRNSIRVSINEEDQRLFAKGQLIQTTSCTADILRFLFYPSRIEGCTSAASCFSVRLAAMDDVQKKLRTHPSSPLEIWGHDWLSVRTVCRVCLQTLKNTHLRARRAFWDKLPEIYGLPQWEELETQRDNAIGTKIFN